MSDPLLTSFDPQGGVRLQDVGDQPSTSRTAVAAGRVRVGDDAFALIQSGSVRKGDVLTVAQIAGILAAKQTSRLLPLCHDVQIKGVDVELTLNTDERAVDIRSYVKTMGPTGVEMEALTAVSIAALTVYDMCKSVSKRIEITDIRLLAKTGGQSGDYLRSGN